MRAVKAVLDGDTQTKVANIFSVSRGAVAEWMKIYREKGLRGLKAKKQGRPSSIKLKPWQAALTVRSITDKLPDQLKLPFALWTREAVKDLIELKFGIVISLSTVGRYLKRWNFTPQKPAKRAIEQDSEQVRKWLDNEYLALKRQAKKESAEIHWGDEMGARSDHQAGRTYGRKGQTPVIPYTGKRFGCNMISTITNRGTLRFMVFSKMFNADMFITFLRRLVKSAGRKVYLIVDRHPVHKSGKVERWLDKHKEQILMFYLPSYSPELNPDELLNNDVKSNAVSRKRVGNKVDLMRNIRHYLHSIQKMPTHIKGFFRAKHVKYADV